MVARLQDAEVCVEKALSLRRWLREDLGLPLRRRPGSQAAAVETFAAFLGTLRACSPLFPQRRAAAVLKQPCPLALRFPTTLPGRLIHYEDVFVCLREIVDHGGGEMGVDKMWRLLLWIFLGNGGYRHQAWNLLKNTRVGRRYEPGHRQPLEVLRWCIRQTSALSHMQVFGSDGLDKKSRLSTPRILYLLDWHDAVPRLVEAFTCGCEAFSRALLPIKGFGELTRKEIIIILGASSHRSLSSVGQLLPFGQGAKNGAIAFLNVPQHTGQKAADVYAKQLGGMVEDIERHIGEFFPGLPKELQKVTLGDIEPCLCAALVYTRLVKQLRKHLPQGRLAPGNAELS